MSKGIQVSEFRWVKGKNDLEYIKLLEKLRQTDRSIINKAIAKVKELDKKLNEIKPVACKECKWRGEAECPMRFEEYVEYDDDGYVDHDWIEHDNTEDDGFCFKGERA